MKINTAQRIYRSLRDCREECARLEVENKRLRAAMREILDVTSPMTAKNTRAIVKEALGI